MKRLTIWGIIACVGLFLGPAAVLGAGPPDGLDVNVVNPLPLPVTGEVDATVTGDVNVNVVNDPGVTVLNDETNPVPVVQTVYRFSGFSTADTDGAAGGIGGMHALCGPDARMCTTKELLLSPNVPTGTAGTPLPLAWVQPTIVTTAVISGTGLSHFDYSGTFYATKDGTCFQWTATTTAGVKGMAFNSGGFVAVTECSVEIPVACCTPTN